jgi:DNA-binding IclR family transcriptional regulator
VDVLRGAREGVQVTTARDRPPEEAAEDTSFARGLRLLLAVADRGGIRADELGTLLDMPLSTVYRYLRTLTDFGFVDRRGSEYSLGPRLIIGGGSLVTSEQLISRSTSILERLVEETGESAVVARRIGLSAVVLHGVASHRPLRVVLEDGSAWPLHAGAIGSVLLAFAPSEIVDEALGAVADEPIGRISDERAARHLIERVSTERSDVSVGEIVPGSVCVAVPIFSQDGIVGALGVIGPEERCGPRWRTRATRTLTDAGVELERAIRR